MKKYSAPVQQDYSNFRLNSDVKKTSFFAQMLGQAKKMQKADWISLFILGATFIPGKMWKLINHHIWVVSEYEHLARDNGYWFFKYLREKHPKIDVYYPICDKSSDLSKIEELGNRVKFSSIKHFLLFWAAEKQFTSSKNAGFPSRICEDLVQWNFHGFDYIMLNHGITRGLSTVVDSSKTNYDFICTCSPKDKEIIVKENGQPPGKVIITGFARHDNLDSKLYNSKQLLVMPTWRSWINYKLGRNYKEKKSIVHDFLKSDYYKTYMSFLNNKQLIALLEKNDMKLVFYLHDYAQYYARFFKSYSDRIIIADGNDYDIQTLLKQSAMLITDYSSVCYDFAYMYKPVLYYQFDKQDFEYHQYAAGEFYTYEDDGMGELFYNEKDIVNGIATYISNGMEMPLLYKGRVETYFSFHDKKNCKRIMDFCINNSN